MLVLGLAAAALMVAAEFATLYSIEVMTASCEDLADPRLADACHRTGGEQHGYALVALALLTGLMALGAGLGGSRPAGIALVAAGVVVLAIVLIGDLPDTGSTGEIGATFTSAEAVRGAGFWLELAGGGLALAAGALRLALRPRERVSRAT